MSVRDIQKTLACIYPATLLGVNQQKRQYQNPESKPSEKTVSKARLMSGWALRAFRTREADPMITIWNSLVRPHLDYCSPLWSPRPSNLKEIDLLEDTQRVFTRNIDGMKDKDYARRISKLCIFSIQRRHERYKILYAYKIKEGLVPNISKTHGLKVIYSLKHSSLVIE